MITYRLVHFMLVLNNKMDSLFNLISLDSLTALTVM